MSDISQQSVGLQADEINLREYASVILKQKKVVFVSLFATVIAATILSFLMPKVYETLSLIQLGSIDQLLIKKEAAREMLLSQNNLSTLIQNLNLNVKLETLRDAVKIEDIANSNLLKIRVRFSKLDTAVKINELISNRFLSYGQALYQEKKAIIDERLNELEQEIQNAESDIKRTQDLIIGAAGSIAASQSDVSLRIILLQNTLPNYESQLTALKNQRNSLKILLVNGFDFKVLDAPVLPKYAVKPNKRLIVFVSAILGLMIGVFLAFIKEWWQVSKKI